MDAPPYRNPGRAAALDRIMPALVAGFVAATVVVIYAVSFAALVFSGSLQPHLGVGIGIALFSAVVVGAAMALGSSYPGAIGTPQDIPAVTLGVIATEIAAAMAGKAAGAEIVATVVAAVALSSLAMGAVFYAFGRFRLGRLIRYIPYPVIGGFLVSVGWFLVRGTYSVATGEPLTMVSATSAFERAKLAHWLPALGFGIVIWLVRRRVAHVLTMPALVAAGIAVFYAVAALAGQGSTALRAGNWLLGPFPEGSLWPPAALGDLARVDPQLLLGQAGNLATMIAISLVMVLLYGGGLEIAVRRDINFNRELRTVGVANLLAGLGGGLPGFHSFSLSVMSDRMQAATRLTGLISAGLCALALLFGAQALTYMPRAVVGGLLVFLSLSLLVEWLVETWFRLGCTDYAIIILILVVSMTFGLLQGVAVGIVVCVAFFVVEYSRLNIVKNELSGAELTSIVDRSEDLRRLLREEGEATHVLKLQGFIFFGTASRLVDRIRRRMDDKAKRPLRFVVIDFAHVDGLDSSVAVAFTKLAQYAGERGFEICLSRVPERFLDVLRRQGLEEEQRGIATGAPPPDGERRTANVDAGAAKRRLRVFPDLDHGLEWCEERLIEAHRGAAETDAAALSAQLADAFPAAADVARFMSYVE
ncbi:MAG: SulP family inorganic anion transporter, partial [Rhodospirillales bacterium]|nr:SulP family inorganic anion transporter [Rhodospirillales bacterium]